MRNQYSSRVDKKTVSLFFRLLVLCCVVGLMIASSRIYSFVFWGALFVVNLILYFVKVPRGYVKESVVMEYLAIFGVLNSIALSVFMALCLGDTLLKCAIILAVCLVLIVAIVLIERKVLTVKYYERQKHKMGYAGVAGAAGGASGVILGRRLAKQGTVVCVCFRCIHFDFCKFLRL
ncbi:MAG: hypothetical protein J6D06_05720 [Clostridia bacterium]|nr:hypothetical protein [Clostridia bacterium]